ncbi:MAG: septum formation inhibitor Maf [Xanthomonadales bacterium]|nr:septum formation inhibitor Maf [Xanthomonadales bacterium]
MPRPLFLASRSPRRAELLRQLGLRFEVLDVDIEEIRGVDESASGYVDRVAREKAGAGLLQVAAVPGAVVIGADTEVMLADEVLGKPADAEAAGAMLRRLSGRAHRVLTVAWCVDAAREESAASESTVEFGGLDAPMIDAYVASGEPFGKAGAYAIQGRAAAFIRRLDGSYSGVMGLPLFETAGLLRRFGVIAA